MVQLINKGGFRERANRSRRYQQSENEQTALIPNKYQPTHSEDSSISPALEPENTQKKEHPQK